MVQSALPLMLDATQPFPCPLPTPAILGAFGKPKDAPPANGFAPDRPDLFTGPGGLVAILDSSFGGTVLS